MKKRILILVAIFISFISFRNDIFAANDYAKEGDTNYSTLKSLYDGGLSKFNISSSNTLITLYGKSVCSSGSNCVYQYDNSGTTSFEEILKKYVSCSNGEKYITYQSTGSGGSDFKGDNNTNYTGTVYWSEDYYITCTSSQTGDTTIGVTNSNTGSSTDNNSSNTSETNSSTSSSSSNNDYSSSSTEKSPQTGVETYYIVLAILAVISYGSLLLVKKLNLFKKI